MTKETKQQLFGFAALAAVVYFIMRPKKVTTSSPAEEKMKLTCAQGEKLVEEPTGLRCVPVSETVSGPTPSVELSFVGTAQSSAQSLGEIDFDKQKFSNPNITGVPVRLVSSFDAKSMLKRADGADVCPVCGSPACRCGWKNYANYVDVKANNFFQPHQGAFYK